jgi:two-component system, cell cycle sensor histidine kinase and response regulator CckA
MLLTARFASAYASETDPTGRPPAVAAPASNEAAARARAPRRILLVEDDPVVRHVVRLLLELEGDAVIEAKDGDDALSLATAYEGTLDLLLTDVMMPGLSGAEVCEKVRQFRPGLPTLFISGFYPEAVFPEQKLPAASAFLAKPFMPEELMEAVDALFAKISGTDGAPRARARKATF